MRKALAAIRFRQFDERDVETLARWLGDAGLGVPARVGAEVWGRRLCRDPRILCRVACDEAGESLGYLRLDIAPDRAAELTIIVGPSERRRGVGRALIEEAVRVARGSGLRRILAMVDRGNRVGREFFLSCGFEFRHTALEGFALLERIVHGADSQPPLEIVP
jgi:GNAT superfamily N-acetyltransferase